MSLTTLLMTNNAGTTLASPCGIGNTTVVLATGTGSKFPVPDGSGNQFFPITLVDQSAGIAVNEICYCTSRSGDTCTVLRGQEGTAQRNWSTGDVAANLLTAGVLQYLAGNTTGFITASSTDNLTNKSMSGTANTFTNLPAAAITGTLPITHGGTGLTSVGSNGQVLTSNGSSLLYTTISTGLLPFQGSITAGAAHASSPILVAGYNKIIASAGGDAAVQLPASPSAGTQVIIRSTVNANIYAQGSDTVDTVSGTLTIIAIANGVQAYNYDGGNKWSELYSTSY